MPFESEPQPEAEERAAKGAHPAPDRRLGDEWEDWDGVFEGEIDEPRGRFILLTALVWICLAVILALLGYLAEPRLSQWPAWLQWTARALFLWVWVGGSCLYFLVLAELLTGVTLLPYRWSARMLLWLLPKAVWIGARFGLSRDRVANSFIKANNSLTRSHRGRTQRLRLLVLLPRCLSKATRQEIRGLIEGKPYGISTVGGGEEARKVIRKERPDFIIALACERDLVSGIRDVALRIPVIGIPNKRPEGPCKNTYIDMEDFRQALNLFEETREQAESQPPSRS